MLHVLSAATCFMLFALFSRAVTLPTIRQRAVSRLSSADLAGLAPFTQFARAAYCPSNSIVNWKCGAACNANSKFQPTLIGGDGNVVQLFFVGYWPDQNAVVVAHEGTDPTKFVSLLTDANILLKNLNSKLFPGVSSAIQVHSGFADQHAQTASVILAEVKSLISQKGAQSVILIGHSLGGALAELDALYMTMNLPSNIHIKAVTYGTPRVGNAAFAALFDSKARQTVQTVPDFKRVNNEEDIVPIVPGRGLGFQHPHGEIHILSSGRAVSCPGDDDATDAECTIASVPNIFDGNILNHLGPYEDIFIGTIFCT